MQLKADIETNAQHKRSVQKKLDKLERERDDKLYEFRSELEENDSVNAMYNQHLHNLRDIEFVRKEKQAEFHIKQREMYIDNLKAQLAMRDQIIKDKLGASITNFLKQDMMTMQDIEGVRQDVLLPSLDMTRTKQFVYNTDGEDNYKSKESAEMYNDVSRIRKKQRNVPATGKRQYPLPKINNDSSAYYNSNQKNLKYSKITKPTNISVGRRDNSISNSFDRRSKKPTKPTRSNLEGLNNKSKDGKKPKYGFGYKPPLGNLKDNYSDNKNGGGFAAQMIKNRNKYFPKNHNQKLKLNKSRSSGPEKGSKHAPPSISNIRNSQNRGINSKFLKADGMESSSIQDTDPEPENKSTAISHHARIKDKLKLLKNNLQVRK